MKSTASQFLWAIVAFVGLFVFIWVIDLTTTSLTVYLRLASLWKILLYFVPCMIIIQMIYNWTVFLLLPFLIKHIPSKRLYNFAVAPLWIFVASIVIVPLTAWKDVTPFDFNRAILYLLNIVLFYKISINTLKAFKLFKPEDMATDEPRKLTDHQKRMVAMNHLMKHRSQNKSQSND